MVRSFRIFGKTFFFLSIFSGKTDIFPAFDPGVIRLLSIFWNRPASSKALCPGDTARGAQDLNPAGTNPPFCSCIRNGHVIHLGPPNRQYYKFILILIIHDLANIINMNLQF